VGVGHQVIDLRTENESEIVANVIEAFNKRSLEAEKLRVTIPEIQRKVLGLFDDMAL
jgi:hypothetical protein